MDEKREAEDMVTVPLRAKAVKVTNVLDPFLMRMYELKDYNEKIDAMCTKLTNLHHKKYFDALKYKKEPEYGDYVVISDQWNLTVDLPAWWCRGMICCEKPVKAKYTVLLIDYGVCINLEKDGFVIIPKSLILEPSISNTISLANILPTTFRTESCKQQNQGRKEQIVQFISDAWSSASVILTMELIGAAKEMYFDHFYTDEKNNIQFGELYLDTEDEIIRLSDVLVAHYFAIRIDKNFIRCMRNPEHLEERIIDDKRVYYLNSNRKVLKGISPKQGIKSLNHDLRGGDATRIIERELQKVLVFTQNDCGFLTSVNDAKFPTKVHMAWNDMTKSSRPKKIQAYIWPAIKKGLDILAIGTKHCGKTLGVVSAVCGLLATIEKIPSGKEPSALILCASSSEVLKVYAWCLELLRDFEKIKIIPAINGKTDRSLVSEMYNGCQILITTPNFFARFMDRNKKLLAFVKLRFLVFDDADIILEKYSHAIKRLLAVHEIIRNRDQELGDISLQTIVVARHWTADLKKFSYALLKSPYVCIASFLEAAIYKSVRPKLYVMSSRYKSKKLLDLLANEYKSLRTVVVCKNAMEAMELNEVLSEEKETLLVHEETKINKIEGIKSSWHAAAIGSYPIFITTDEALADLDITNVDWLIHYSISLAYKTRFNFRYSTLFDNLLKETCNSKVTILADESNDFQFQSIVSMMQRMKLVLSPEMQKTIQHVAVTLEQRKKNRPVCNNIKALGFCPEQNSCPFRHCILPKVDDPLTNIQINDRVKFMVICLHSAGHMSARIISYIDSETREEVQFPNSDYVALYAKMRQYYSEIENRRASDSINVGDICAFEESLDDFKRVQIIHVEEEEGQDKPKFVNVRCIDNGIITRKLNPYKLLYIPTELRNLPCQVVEVFLSNVAPQDDEYTWDSTATNFVRNWFKDNLDERSYVIGTVRLHLADTIWVDTLEVGTKIVGYQDLVASSLKEELLDNDLAVVNKQHINELYKICRNSDFTSINRVDISTSTESSG